ncbi:MAG: serine/threonine-protein kinase, partial [Planctomycetota bacterium]
MSPSPDDATASDDAPPPDEAMRLLGAARILPPGVGERVGPYELRAEIGRGAASAVFRAHQEAPVRRDIALKVLLDPSASSSVATRFRRERALLARLAHPGIVPLLDAGEVEGASGSMHPWFAMPLVEGDAADRWCERFAASRALRLRILEEAARAVGAAHALGIVHRDLKPSNVLVSGTADSPTVHVIDFGIAKLLDASAGDAAASDATRAGAVVGTPEFMSPEQADLDQARVGPASDVYALGLLACVLLAGRVPGASGAQGGATPLGARLRAAAAREVPPLDELAGDRSLRGEVAWIVAKCLAPRPEDRYASGSALAADLERLRNGAPISAAPPDAGYEVTYVLRRHRAALIGAVAAIAAIVGGFWWNAQTERARAEREASRSTELSKLLERARLQLQPLTGRGRGDAVDNAKAAEVAETLHAINRSALGPAAVETQQSALVLARAFERVDRFADSEALYREMLAQAEATGRRGDVFGIGFWLGQNLRSQGGAKLDEARRLVEASIEYWQSLPSPPYSICNATIELGLIAGAAGDFDRRREMFEKGVACAEAGTGA